MVIKKFNQSESAQKIHATINWCHIHAHHFWWAWLLWFRRYCYLQKRSISPFDPWTIVHGHQKIQSIGSGSKNSCNYKLMSHTCTPILVGVTSPVSEILLPSKTVNFPFRPMDYSPWSSKNSIDRNWLKIFMQLWIDVNYMYTGFGGRGLFGFGDTATFKTANFPFQPMDYSPWSSKNSINRNRLKKFMQL